MELLVGLMMLNPLTGEAYRSVEEVPVGDTLADPDTPLTVQDRVEADPTLFPTAPNSIWPVPMTLGKEKLYCVPELDDPKKDSP